MKVCSLCEALVFDSDWINHFRQGDEKHRKIMREVYDEIELKEELAILCHRKIYGMQ